MIVKKEVGLIQLKVLAHELLMSKVYILTLTASVYGIFRGTLINANTR
jgi:hypothetical protein